MKQYEVVFSKTVVKSMSKLPTSIVNKIIPVLESLASNPRPVGCKKLKGFDNLWRVRIGDYRAIYAIEDVIFLVDVRDVGHRKDIYKP
jgi:mRNA interferase RelE/StbE